MDKVQRNSNSEIKNNLTEIYYSIGLLWFWKEMSGEFIIINVRGSLKYGEFLGRHYAKSRKVACSIPIEVIGFFSIDLFFPASLWVWNRLSP
jgi:hypothetical protein